MKLDPFTSRLPWGGTISGQGTVHESWNDPETGDLVVRSLAARPDADGFASAWHRAAYVDGLRREIAGCETRAASIEADPDHPERAVRLRADAKAEADAARGELERLGEDVPF